MTDANGNTSTSYKDGAGRILAVQHPTVQLASSQLESLPLGSPVIAGYTAHDANGNRVATRDPNGLGEDCDYDAINRDIYCADLQEQNDTTGRSKTYNTASQPVTGSKAFVERVFEYNRGKFPEGRRHASRPWRDPADLEKRAEFGLHTLKDLRVDVYRE